MSGILNQLENGFYDGEGPPARADAGTNSISLSLLAERSRRQCYGLKMLQLLTKRRQLQLFPSDFRLPQLSLPLGTAGYTPLSGMPSMCLPSRPAFSRKVRTFP